jgi:serine acetyltransferase/GT2 family glycosyltransferase
MDSSRRPQASVVIATFNRGALLRRLLDDLAQQTLPAAEFEVVVVDDGSTQPVLPLLAPLAFPFALRVETQQNAGAAAARHRGVTAARAEIVVILDDDMQVEPAFLEAHLRAHPPGTRRAVLGAIRRPPDFEEMPLFERWHQKLLEGFAERAAGGEARLRGNELYTANLSFRREDYLAVGGFDRGLERSEDAELGLRLEAHGVEIGFADQAASVNGSDHTSLEKWRGRSVRYGAFDAVIARKHARVRHASPWRYFESVSPLAAPLLFGPSLLPPAARLAGSAAYAAAAAADRLGWRKLAYTGVGVTYGIDYFRGLRAELGGLGMLVDLARYLRSAERLTGQRFERLDLLARLASDVRADHAMVLQYGAKYHPGSLRGNLARDAVQRIGLQMMVAIRVMHLFRDAGLTLAAKLMSRSIRHLYAADIHWEARFEPGVVIGHGYALGISGGVRIGTGCILLHGTSIGMGRDATGKAGEPCLERNVHVGPHAIILGPITIGEGSKIQAGALVTQSVPPHSVVWAPRSEIRPREQRQPEREVAAEPVAAEVAADQGVERR